MEDFVLTADTYYSKEASDRYCSFHDYLQCVGHGFIRGCEAKYKAIKDGLWEEDKKTTALLVGGYFDAFYDNSLEQFKKDNPECFTQKGELKAPFKQAEKMIARTLEDEKWQAAVQGEKQKIFTGYWAGAEWKCKLDVYNAGHFISDIKTCADIHRAWRMPDIGGYMSFVEAYFYTGQLALYQKIVEINTGEKLPCLIPVVSKSDNPEIELIGMSQADLDNALNEIEMNMPSYLAIRNGEYEPVRCERCDYCKATKKIMKPIHFNELIWGDE